MGADEVDADFRCFVAARQRSLLRAAWLLTGDWATAEDLVQTALVHAWPHWGRIGGSQGSRGREGAEAYVRRTMVNQALDWSRRRWRGEVPTADLPDGPFSAGSSSAGSAAETHLVLVAALQTLPPRQRVVIVLRYFQDLTEADTAEAMDCTVGTVKTHASRALATLRQHPRLADLRLQGSA